MGRGVSVGFEAYLCDPLIKACRRGRKGDRVAQDNLGRRS